MITAALDTSAKSAAFHVRDGDVTRVDLSSIPTGRASAALFSRMLEALQEAELEINDIRRWTVGMGPGSFTGIRIGAALVKGICAGNGAAYRGVPSSFALAMSAKPDPGDSVAALHDGRRGEMLVSPYVCQVGGKLTAAEPFPMKIDDLISLDHNIFVALAQDRALEECRNALGDLLTVVDHMPAAQLLTDTFPWPTTAEDQEATMEPVYIRPAVHTPPPIQ